MPFPQADNVDVRSPYAIPTRPPVFRTLRRLAVALLTAGRACLRRPLRVLAALLVLISLLVLESQCIVSGLLRGEAFYKGRPTSYWKQVVLDPERAVGYSHNRDVVP